MLMASLCQSAKRGWRIAGTGFSFSLFSLGALVIGLLFLLLAPIPLSPERKQRWARAAISRACLFYVRLMRLMGLLSYSLKLGQNQGQGRLIIANHPTLLDAIFLLSAYPNICCIAKGSLWDSPFTSFVVRQAGYIPNHSETLIDQSVAKLNSGDTILIFPEGTRSYSGSLLALKRGAANIAVQAECDIVPIVIQCEPITLQKGKKWYDIPESIPHFSLNEKPVLVLADIIDVQRPRTVQYRHLTRYLSQYFLTSLQAEKT